MFITVKTLKILEENPDYLEILENIIRFEETFIYSGERGRGI